MRFFLYIFSYILFVSSQNLGQLSPEFIFEKVSPSIVKVYGYDFDYVQIRQGSGIVIDSNTIITNFHIFSGCKEIEVQHYNKFYTLKKILGVDVVKDILVFSIDEKILSAIDVSKQLDFRIGERIYAIGSPLGFENSITEGLISGYRLIDGANLLQISAQIYSGSSGGAVVNDQGELIGVSSSKISNTDIGFAIPIDVIFNLSTYCGKSDTLCPKKLDSFIKCYNAFFTNRYNIAYEYLKKYFNVDPSKAVHKELKREIQYLTSELILNQELTEEEFYRIRSITDWNNDFDYCLEGLYKLKYDGLIREAITNFIEASKIDSLNGDYYYHLGLCYDELNSKKSKIYFFKRAYYAGRTDLGLYLWKEGAIQSDDIDLNRPIWFTPDE